MNKKINHNNAVTNSMSITRKQNFIAVILCMCGVLTNFIFIEIVEKTGIPLYLDTVGTIAVSSFGGYLPGILVGFFTNIVKCTEDKTSIYYGVINVLIALASAFFTRRGRKLKVFHILALIAVLTLIGGGLGTLMPWFLDNVGFESESIGNAVYNTGNFSVQDSQLIGNLIMDLADKTVTVLIVIAIGKLLPENLKNKFSFHDWKQKPLSKDDVKSAQNCKNRVMSLQSKILIVFTIALMFIAVSSTVISLIIYRNSIIKERMELAESVASIASSIIDPEKVDFYIEQGDNSEEYRKTESKLKNLLDSSKDIEYIYIYKILEDGCHVVFDIDTEEVKGDNPGDIIPFDEAFNDYLPNLFAGENIDPIISDESYGWLLTDYQPVYNSEGKCVCYSAADVSMKQLVADEKSFVVEMLSLFLGIFILVIAFVWELVEYHIILPVNSMSFKTRAFAYDNEKAREESIEGIKELFIHTGDEIEYLYEAIVKTSVDSMQYVTAIQEKTETIAQMQKALIMVLADMVESRDKNTGDHIRKTAAYTAIILKKMKEKGYYSEQLTDEFIANVVDSAPLHDIGKIQVPDAILNKPGRLTDEEFTKMKTHTTAGGEILEQVIKLVPDSVYLREAKNLAEYHHEKWDGTGYPHGISGENIPLSARVMAVADVFDALVSRRSYKEPFPFDRALDIIREGAGKHFDPKIADAFLSAEDEVIEIAEKFDKMSSGKI